MTKAELIYYLMRKLDQAFADEWDPNRPTRVEVIEESGATGLCFLARRRDGSWSCAHEEPPVPLSTSADVDNMLARGLSLFLMKHPSWPR